MHASLFEDGCEELKLSENSSDNSILFINSTFGQAPGISKLYFMCSDESEIFLSICDSTGRWKPDPACNSIIIPPTIPTTNSTDNNDDDPQDIYNMPTMPRDLIPSFSLYIMAGFFLLLFVMISSIVAIIWRRLKRNKNASITTQPVPVTEPIYESIMDHDADIQVKASYQVRARVDLIKNEAYTTTQPVTEPTYESTMDDSADTQVNASYQVCARVDLTKNEAYASSAGVAESQ